MAHGRHSKIIHSFLILTLFYPKPWIIWTLAYNHSLSIFKNLPYLMKPIEMVSHEKKPCCLEH
jgi:hypothetical protein